MLTGMLPQLEYDGFVLSETNAIAHFLGKQLNLAGKDTEEEANCVMFANLISDFVGKSGKIRREPDPEKQKAMKAELEATTLPQFFKTMVGMLQINGGKYLVGKQVQ